MNRPGTLTLILTLLLLPTYAGAQSQKKQTHVGFVPAIFSGEGTVSQNQSSLSGAPDVIPIKISWRRVAPGNPKLESGPVIGNPDAAGRMAVNTARINENRSARDSGLSPPAPVLLSIPTPIDSPPMVRPWSGYIYEFTIKNTGSKVIRKLAWEYSFTDPLTQRKVGARHYKSNVRIRPGMIAKLTLRSSLGPIGTISAAQAGQNTQDPGQMVIESIKYADGTMWQRSAK